MKKLIGCRTLLRRKRGRKANLDTGSKNTLDPYLSLELLSELLPGISCEKRRDIADLYFIQRMQPAMIAAILRVDEVEVRRQIRMAKLILLKSYLSFITKRKADH